MLPHILTIIRNTLAHRYYLRPEPEITAQTQFADLVIDSLDRVTLCMAIEEQLGVHVTDDEAKDWTSVSDILRAVEREGVACG